MLYYIIALVIIALDQLTKWLIVNELEIGERIPVIENVLYITSHRNQGAAWGILQGQMWFFYVITVIVVIGLVIYIQKYAKDQRLMGIALGLMLGGAIGNFIDRVIHQEVVDFVQTYIGTYPFPIFNIADSALCVGVALLFIVMLFEGKQEKEKVNEQHRN
ncbi:MULTISPECIES: signal peptidase II [Metabacillus]|uniref:Signal peptidase II n=1 Tax=Metabacillus hrfriensis TaxID=3048891 RepID=A0ACD4RGV3_9BACI|nr:MULTISPECIES: signal peptidase II [Metabacillus]UAL54181.1 signal peptidase II [Metabacillus dongyingensis]USK30501.1 signal peptidase II [Bacillus sp. CMF21]WHZ59751.1 signal peptidase II [Metabacillus sp. CT-WN-B3]